MRINKLSLFSILIILLISCSHQKKADKKNYYKASDFSAPGEFTSGIEGPAWASDHFLYLVNFEKEGTIGRINSNGKSELFIDLPEGSIGNGIRFHSDGSMLIADYKKHNILRIDMKTKEISVYAHSDEMNQPNDLAISGNNTLYLSDPDWGNSTGKLWRVDPDGKISLLEEEIGTTNGVEVSPGDSILYVNESVQRNIWAYKILPNGDITNKRLFYKFDDFGMDGMRCDKEGNLYVTRYGKGTVVVLSPGGEKLHEIQLKGKKPSNIAFGGEDGNTCFVTLQDRGSVEKFYTEVSGRDF